MDLYALDEHSSDQRVLLVTASGGHSDSLFACARLPRLPLASAVFCGALESPGEQMLAGTAVDVYAYDLLPDVHGWVAVNVLLAQAVVLARAFDTAFPGTVGALPADLASLLPDRAGVGPSLDGYEDGLRAVLQQPVLAFLHGHESRSAQRDLDSKFAESGLGELASSEYRNFAHGRYQAILPREEAFGVLGFATAAELPIARASFALLPDDLPHALIELAGESAAAQQVSGLIGVLFVVGALERVRGIPVGWGSRETFGDALYELDLGEIVPPLPET